MIKRVGITQRVDVVAAYGERRDALDQQWAQLLWRAGLMMVPLPNGGAPAAELIAALGLAAVVLSGGNDLASLPNATNSAPERDAFERSLLDAARAQGLAVLGVCRGMQHVVHYFGGSLRRIDGHVATRHALKSLSDTWDMQRAEVNSYHGFGCLPEDLPSCLRPLALAPDGTVEAVEHTQEKLLGMMWHPERAPACAADVQIIQQILL